MQKERHLPRLIELMAKAICAEQGGDPEGVTVHDSKGVRFAIHEWAKYEKSAIVALRAMRSPTGEQLKLFLAEEDAVDDDARKDEVVEVWQGMIDAALEEQGG